MPATEPPDLTRRRALWPALALALAVAIVFGPVVSFGFLAFDDPEYVTANVPVQEGLSLAGMCWAATSFAASNWHPLTWLSHQADVALWGLAPGGHHLTSLALHALNAALAVALVRALTGSLGTGLLVAALFALHPMRAESVAWIAERKDLLAATFTLLALLAYLSWQRGGRSAAAGLAVHAATALALLAKPMAVTLPFLFLLFDAWPLGRFAGDRRARALIAALSEKLALFLMAGGAALLTVVAQRERAIASLAELPFGRRLAAAAVAPLDYLARTLWPSELSVLYPHPYLPGGVPPSAWAIAAGALALVLFVGFALAGRLSGAVAVGGLWFLGSLLPVLGLVQVGEQATADRYTYLGHLGLFLALAGAAESFLTRRLPPERARRALVAAGALAVALVVLATARWLPAWSDTRTLAARSLEATPNSPVLLWALGREELAAGALDAAFEHVKRAIELRPVFAEAHHTLGNVFEAQGRLLPAERQYELALDIHPRYPPARADLDRLRAASHDAAR